MINKKCGKCGKMKPISKYIKNKSNKYKKCMECENKTKCTCGLILPKNRLKYHIKSKSHSKRMGN